MNNRIERLINKLKENNINNILITDTYAIYYFCKKWYHPEERLVMLNVSSDGRVILYVNKLFPTEEFGPILKWYQDT
ncbi:MAG: aminopeptidase P family N-terminal domain-containing protein, partial [Anaerococcus sp.]